MCVNQPMKGPGMRALRALAGGAILAGVGICAQSAPRAAEEPDAGAVVAAAAQTEGEPPITTPGVEGVSCVACPPAPALPHRARSECHARATETRTTTTHDI